MKQHEKIEKLNKYCDGSISFVHYTKWQISSYQDGSLFNPHESLYREHGGNLEHENFKGLIDLAYREMLADKEKKNY